VQNSLPDPVQDLIRNWQRVVAHRWDAWADRKNIGNIVALFCSEQAGWTTGQVIYADGGASLMTPEVPSEIQLG
jgi:enoyl-[acyl-carrier-protein] reductase (NADH)